MFYFYYSHQRCKFIVGEGLYADRPEEGLSEIQMKRLDRAGEERSRRHTKKGGSLQSDGCRLPPFGVLSVTFVPTSADHLPCPSVLTYYYQSAVRGGIDAASVRCVGLIRA